VISGLFQQLYTCVWLAPVSEANRKYEQHRVELQSQLEMLRAKQQQQQVSRTSEAEDAQQDSCEEDKVQG
jgi:hypothetical protein